jgi:nucleoside-diphosphate-sugar epimerase
LNLNSSQVEHSPVPPQVGSPQIKVLLIGATGFIGSRILEALQALTDVRVLILARRPDGFPSGQHQQVFLGDVTDPASLSDAVTDADVVINAASYIGHDPQLAERVNQEGAATVVKAWENSDAKRLIHLSTTAVYGSGPHRQLHANDAPYRPESVASRRRAAGEQTVLAAGGVVVRPNLVYGAGDRWFIPGAVRMFTALGTQIENGKALLSVIDVTDLGRLVAALSTTAFPVTGPFHAAYPTPVTLEHLLGAIDQQIAPLHLQGDSSLKDAVQTLEPAGFRPHQVHMLGMDHYYESQDLWDIAGMKPPEQGFSADTLDWYRERTNP